jgi:hypothetical protein
MIEEGKDQNEVEKSIIKLADFGWSCQYFTEKRKTICGTPECKITFLTVSYV